MKKLYVILVIIILLLGLTLVSANRCRLNECSADGQCFTDHRCSGTAGDTHPNCRSGSTSPVVIWHTCTPNNGGGGGGGGTPIVHCWDIEGRGDSSAQARFQNATATNITVNGVNYEQIIIPGSTMTVNNFGSYNFRCDNGDSQSTKAYYITQILDVDTNSEKAINGNGPQEAENSDFARCEGSGSSLRRGAPIGIGTADSYTFTFGSDVNDIQHWIGGHSYNTYRINTPDPESYNRDASKVIMPDATGKFYFAANPGLLVFNNEIDQVGFYEKNGEYVKEVFFTLNAKSILDIRIEDYNIECSDNASCSVDRNNIGYTIIDDGIMIIKGTITVDKDDIPKDVFYRLNVNYSVPELSALDYYSSGFDISSEFANLNVGYLDQQDFQVKIIGNISESACIGADGMIGQTGDAVAPRINIEFGGSDGDVNSDECISSNDNWVYCSQREFMTDIANKLVDLYDVEYRLLQTPGDEDLIKEKERLQNFTINVRDLELLKARNDELINEFENTVFSNGLPNLGNDAEVVARMKNLFDIILFTKNGGRFDNSTYPVGEYFVNMRIDFDTENPPNDLFELGTNNIESRINDITVDLTPTGIEPLIDWFFYDNSIDELSIDNIDSQEELLFSSNVNNRGRVFSFNHIDGTNNIAEGTIYPSYAAPLFVKVDSSDLETNVFDLESDGLTTQNWQGDVFTYWNGFASRIEGGTTCEELKEGENSLVYRYPDYFNQEQTELKIYDTDSYNLKNGEEYLETIIYAPKKVTTTAEKVSINGKNNIYTRDGICTEGVDGRCSVDISSESGFSVSDISEVISGINQEKICVNNRRSGNQVVWTLFWNENKVKELLNPVKDAQVDSSLICTN
jgi:hypothetical protein